MVRDRSGAANLAKGSSRAGAGARDRLSKEERQLLVTQAWRQSDSPKAFVRALEELSYVLATGNRLTCQLTKYDGSMFELRAVTEPYVRGDIPSENVIIYLPGCERDRQGSVLMELEKAGECYEPQLKRLARNVLRQRYTDGVID